MIPTAVLAPWFAPLLTPALSVSLPAVCAIIWMCFDIDHDIALDEAAKQLTAQALRETV